LKNESGIAGFSGIRYHWSHYLPDDPEVFMSDDTAAYTKDEVEQIFRNSVSGDMYQKILAMDPPLLASIEEKQLTTLFTDVRGLSRLQNEMGLEASSRLVVEILGVILAEAISRNGYVDKFIADAALVVFGAPVEQTLREQNQAACRTALAVIKKVRALGADLGVGFHSGTASIGCYSPRSLPTYTPMGDVVNFASRLETLSKSSGNRPAIAGSTREFLEPEFRTVFVDSVVAKSYADSGTIEIFTIVGERGAMSEAEQAYWDRYDEGVEQLLHGSVETALGIIEKLSTEKPGDTLLITALDRARRAYAASLGQIFIAADSLDSLAEELFAAGVRLFGMLEMAMLEQGLDGMWRFRNVHPFVNRQQLLSPDGDALAWFRGLSGPSLLTSNESLPDTYSSIPPALEDLGFAVAVPVRIRNKLEAVLLLSEAASTDLVALGLMGDTLAAPWFEKRNSELSLRYHEKIDDATKLEESNRELESQSAALARALREIRSMNENLEVRVAEAVNRLERAASLKRYLPPQVVDDILEGRRELQPRTERRKLTILFSDVRGFTTATDGLEPEELARLLDEYLSAMSDIAFSAGATIDKFRGDGMMLFFGAPESIDPRAGAIKCLRMAVAMSQDIERLRLKWFDEGYDWDLGVRMGINTGYATVGEFGSSDRMDYTAVGTEVNLAARLEGCCETESIIVSHSTWALVRDEFPCTYIGETELKGIHKPVRVYRVDWRNGKEN
jgi:class 3 adenylate cyclase